MNEFNLSTFNVKEYHAILNRGLSAGMGERGGQVCIEAAICQVLGLPHGDDPGCVEEAVRAYKIALNDARWSSPAARAEGMRALGLAQLGSRGVVKGKEFTSKLAEKTIRVLIPAMFREVFEEGTKGWKAAERCEREGSPEAAWAAWAAARAARAEAVEAAEAAWAAAEAAWAAARAARAEAAWAAARAAVWAAARAVEAVEAVEAAAASCKDPDKYLRLSAALALGTLRELGSPGVELG